jgi:hypothetical protein
MAPTTCRISLFLIFSFLAAAEVTVSAWRALISGGVAGFQCVGDVLACRWMFSQPGINLGGALLLTPGAEAGHPVPLRDWAPAASTTPRTRGVVVASHQFISSSGRFISAKRFAMICRRFTQHESQSSELRVGSPHAGQRDLDIRAPVGDVPGSLDQCG